MKLTLKKYAVVGALALAACLQLVPGAVKAAETPEGICNPVYAYLSGTIVHSASGLAVIHKGSYECPDVVQPVVTAQTDFLVFFDWDKSKITAEARKIISDAATAAQSLKAVRIDVTGHTDTSGSVRYNQKLSLRRAAAVKAELVARGINPSTITTVGKGESELMVPTKDGVREPSNRRAQIIIVTN